MEMNTNSTTFKGKIALALLRLCNVFILFRQEYSILFNFIVGKGLTIKGSVVQHQPTRVRYTEADSDDSGSRIMVTNVTRYRG